MRSHKIDFFRGLALIIIFIDHVYDNRLGGYTLRGYGIADAGEIFFFCSGFVAALVYGKALERSGFASAQARATRRAVLIYVFHIAAFVVLVGATWLLKDFEGVETVVRARQLSSVIYGDIATGLGILTFQYQPFLFTILPAYVALSLATPAFAALQRRSPWLLLGVSLAIYLLLQVQPSVNFTQGPHDAPWVFNPFAYQFVFVIGMVCGGLYGAGRLRVPLRMDLAIVAVLVLGVVFVFHNFIPFLQKHFQLFSDYAYPRGLPWTGKVNEEPLRIAHFLVLGYAVLFAIERGSSAFPAAAVTLKRAARPVARCGRHSIYIFSLGLVLSYFGGYVIAGFGNGAMVWIPVNAAGIALLLGAAAWLEHWRRPGGRRFQDVT